jgi:hypothetical protein
LSFSLGDDLGAAALRLGHHVGDPLLRVGEALAAFLAGCDAVGIAFWRVSTARIGGGQTKRAVNQMNAANAIACMARVKLMFIIASGANGPAAVHLGWPRAGWRPQQSAGPTPMMNDASIRPGAGTPSPAIAA